VLNGSAVANGEAATGWFRYDTTDPGACSDAFGTRAPASGGTALGAGSEPAAFSEALWDLTGGTVYYFCAIAENAHGIAFGEILTFAPGVPPPTVTTGAASGIDAENAVIAGTANPNGTEATGWFRLGDSEPAACDDGFGSRVPAAGGAALGAGDEPVPFEESLTALLPNATYYYCAAAANLGGAIFGDVLSFTTDAVPPVIRTILPDITEAGEATLNGEANPRGSETTVWFRTDTVYPGFCNDGFGTRWPAEAGASAGAGRANVPFSEPADGLAPGTYYVCAIGENEAGVAFGELLSFTIPGATPPTTSSGGCGCRTVSRPGGDAVALLPLVGLLLLAFRRRRRG
jgi:MYXO-CTERM domain-containing protein